MFREALAAARARLGEYHRYTLYLMSQLAECLRLQEALPVLERVLGPDHPSTRQARETAARLR